MKRLNQSGSHVLAVALLVLALGAVGFTGYHLVQTRQQAATAKTAAQSAIPSKISSDADLNQTSTALDTFGADLDNSLDDSMLDADLNSML